jgi:outer membrane protein assembly factor BamA
VLARASEGAGAKVIIDDIVLDSPTDVDAPVWDRIVSDAKREPITKGEASSGDDWLEALKEVGLRGRLQSEGYYTANVTAEAEVISSSPTLEHVVIHAHVRGGTQYKLSGVQFRNQDPEKCLVHSTEELRNLIPLHDGDVFSAEKVRNGLDELSRFYNSQGYIDFVAGVETQSDDMQREIALTLSLDEGVQFRLGQIEVVGLGAMLEKEFRSKVRAGDLVNTQLIANFYKDHKSELPEEVLPEDSVFRRNFKGKVVDAFFDFRSCSQLLQH